eukprot:3743404-Lingulodinium_polyedra.AAC.1
MLGVSLWVNAYVETLAPHDLQPNHALKQGPVASQRWLKRLRGANGALQWLRSNTRPDLSADASINAGTPGAGIACASITGAQKIIRKAHARIN